MNTKNIFVGFILLSFFSFSFAQSADEIIERHLENSGGKKNWNKLNSLIIKGSVALTVDDIYNIEIYHRRPYFKSVIFIQGTDKFLNEGYDGKSGYTYNPTTGKNVKVPDYKPDAFESDIMNYKNKGFKVKFLEELVFEGQNCFKIELLKNSNRIIYYFRKSDYELIAEDNLEEILLYDNYKSFSGLKFATRITGRPKNGGEYVLNFNEVQINPYIADKVFRF